MESFRDFLEDSDLNESMWIDDYAAVSRKARVFVADGSSLWKFRIGFGQALQYDPAIESIEYAPPGSWYVTMKPGKNWTDLAKAMRVAKEKAPEYTAKFKAKRTKKSP